MCPADCVADCADLVIAKFDHPIANGAMHMIVSRIPVVVLVRRAICQAKFAKQAGLNEQPQRSIDRSPADRMTRIMHIADQLVGIEMFMRIEDLADEDTPGFGKLLAADLQELPKFRLGAIGDGKRCQLIDCANFGHKHSPEQSPSWPQAAKARSLSKSNLILAGSPRMIQRRGDRLSTESTGVDWRSVFQKGKTERETRAKKRRSHFPVSPMPARSLANSGVFLKGARSGSAAMPSRRRPASFARCK